jgi:hypothetical protein
MLQEARERLGSVTFPSDMAGEYSFGVLEHAQPSFMLLPLMFLSLAEKQGGITAKHRAYLPWFMLSMEVIAVVDDTLDAAMTRSGRTTYVERYGSMGALPFSHFLLATALGGAAEDIPEAVPLLAKSFTWLCSLETIEVATRYPELNEERCERLLNYHYEQAICEVMHASNAALALHGLPNFPAHLGAKIGELMQDVDDLVNLVEQREIDGENDDLKLGTVTYPLLSTLRADPEFACLLDAFWAPYQKIQRNERQAFLEGLARCERMTIGEHKAVRERMLSIGVPLTLAKIEVDTQDCIDAAPVSLRSYVRSICLAFARRVDHMR